MHFVNATEMCLHFSLQKMDKNRDGVVTLDEFILSCQEVFFMWSYSLDNHSTKFPTFLIYVVTIKPFHFNFNMHKVFFIGLHCPLVVNTWKNFSVASLLFFCLFVQDENIMRSLQLFENVI